MAPRLRLLLLLLPAGCGTPENREAVAMRGALESGRASLAAVAPAMTPIQAGLPGASPSPAEAPSPADTPERAPGRPTMAGFDIHPVHAPSRPAAAAQLLGAAPETLRRWLGEPALRRREGTAEVWLYAGAACALDLVLYPAAGGGSLRVAHAEARASGAEPRTEAACLREIGTVPGPAPRVAGPLVAGPADRGA